MPASRMLSAISFGVFCRSAPSTRAIMRSRNEEPGEDVILTTIQSEITVVPPVTAERSPPASRITGADSPVTADSFTEAMPSTTSPSPGMTSPASTSTTSPGLVERGDHGDFGAPRGCGEPLRHRLGACAAQGIRLGTAAAFGDRLGEVGEQHRDPQPERDLAGEAGRLAGDEIAENSTVTRRETTAVTKITGLRMSTRGSSLAIASLPRGGAAPGRPAQTCSACVRDARNRERLVAVLGERRQRG